MDFLSLAQACAPVVDPKTLAAIVRTESGFNPLAIGINARVRLARQPQTKTEAIATAKQLISRGYNIDMGLGQINSANLPKLRLSIDDVFDPCKNLSASGMILQASYLKAKQSGQGEQSALHSALSAYNTGSFQRGFHNGYVQKVIRNAGYATKPGRALSPASKTPHLPAKNSQPSDPFTQSVMVYP